MRDLSLHYNNIYIYTPFLLFIFLSHITCIFFIRKIAPVIFTF